MKSLTEYISEAKVQVESYTQEEIEQANAKLQQKKIKLMLSNDDGEHVYIKPIDAKKFYEPIKNFRVSEYDIKQIPEELRKKLWVISFKYEYDSGKSRINGVLTTAWDAILTNLGMFFNSKQEANQYMKGKRDRIKYGGYVERKYTKIAPMTLFDWLGNIEKIQKSSPDYDTAEMVFKKLD